MPAPFLSPETRRGGTICRQTWTCRITAVAFVALGLLGACGDSSEQPPAADTTTPSPSPALKPERFDKVKDMVAAMAEAGVDCQDYKRLKVSQESLKDFGLCFLDGDRTYETDIYLVSHPSLVDGWIEQYDEYDSINVLFGYDWFITSGSVEQLKTIKEALGGEIRPK